RRGSRRKRSRSSGEHPARRAVPVWLDLRRERDGRSRNCPSRSAPCLPPPSAESAPAGAFSSPVAEGREYKQIGHHKHAHAGQEAMALLAGRAPIPKRDEHPGYGCQPEEKNSQYLAIKHPHPARNELE